jgi:transposase
MPVNHRLAADVVQRIEDLLRTGLDVGEVYATLQQKVSKAKLYKMARRLRDFGTVTPAPICKQDRPRSITPEAQEGIVEFLIEHDKQATVEEVRIFLEEEFDIQVSWSAVQRAIKQAQFTRKVVS